MSWRRRLVLSTTRPTPAETLTKIQLPPRYEYTLYVLFESRQQRLYRKYLDQIGIARSLISDYAILFKIWTFPPLLEKKLQEEDANDAEGLAAGLQQQQTRGVGLDGTDADDEGEPREDTDEGTEESINDGGETRDPQEEEATQESANEDDDDETIDPNVPSCSKSLPKAGDIASPKPTAQGTTAHYTIDAPRGTLAADLFERIYPGEVDYTDTAIYKLSNKLIVIRELILLCEELGDKLIIFSQSVQALTVMRKMLEYDMQWVRGTDFDMMTGGVTPVKRDKIKTAFNGDKHPKLRVLLLSTKAVCQGIDLIGANHLCLFDICWYASFARAAPLPFCPILR
jgi:transcriptional regulator ATRX